MGAHTGVSHTAALRTAAERHALATWIPVTTIGEAIGFAAPAAVGAATVSAAPGTQLTALLVAGAVEGAVLGAAQAWAMHRLAVPVRSGPWVALTAVGAAVAYLCGLAPTTWAAGVFTEPSWTAIPVAALLGAILLASIGGAQWWELRRRVPRAGHWVWITAVAWLCALGAFLLIATPLWREGQPVWLTIAIGAGAGLVMAAVAAAITGWGLARILPLRRMGS